MKVRSILTTGSFSLTGARRAVIAFLCALSCFCAAIIGTYLSLNESFAPSDDRDYFNGIARDGWIAQDAWIDLSSFAPGATSIEVRFNPWRPGDLAPAVLTLSICGKTLAPFTVEAATAESRFKLDIPCEPSKLGFHFENPFETEKGRRILGAQLTGARIRYSLSPQLLVMPRFLIAFAALTVLSLFAVFSFLSYASVAFGAGLLPAFGALSLSFATQDTFPQLAYLWLVLMGLLVGANLIRFLSDYSARSSEILNGSRYTVILVGLCVVAGALLRFHAVDFGLPGHFHPDEPRKGSIALRMLTEGKFDPNYFLHPTLLLYLTALSGKILNSLGLTELSVEGMIFAGRCVSALAGTLTIYLLFLLGRRLFSTETGLFGAALFALFPLAVTCSRYLKEDSLLVMFFVACALAMVKGAQEHRRGYIYLCGILGGLATSSKYSGMLSVVIVGCAPLFAKNNALRKDLIVPTLTALVLVPIAFVAGSPYVLINFAKFSSHFGAEETHMRIGHHNVAIDAWSQFWMYHFSHSIVPGVTGIVAIAAVLALGLFAAELRWAGYFVIGCFLLFYLPAEWVKAKPPPQPERYVLPALPFIALAAGEFIRRLRLLRTAPAIGLLILCLLSAGLRSFSLASEVGNDTRSKMQSWIVQNIPRGAKVIVDAEPYSAYLDRSLYEVRPLWTPEERRSMTIDYLKASGFDYILLTSLSYDRYFASHSSDEVVGRRMQSIFNNLPLVVEFTSKNGPYGFHNPDLRLYKLK